MAQIRAADVEAGEVVGSGPNAKAGSAVFPGTLAVGGRTKTVVKDDTIWPRAPRTVKWPLTEMGRL